jgi:hypothetical protein
MAVTMVETRAITGTVDTPADVRAAAALDPVGGLLGVQEFPATPAGYARLLGWLGGFGTVCWPIMLVAENPSERAHDRGRRHAARVQTFDPMTTPPTHPQASCFRGGVVKAALRIALGAYRLC